MFIALTPCVIVKLISLGSIKNALVVSIDLIWVFFMPFRTMEYSSDQIKYLPPIQFSTFWVLKLFFYILKDVTNRKY